MRTPALLALALVAAAAGPAAGQEAGSGIRNHNSNAPVDVEADRIEVQDRADRAVFSGNVRARQADLNLAAQRITVAYSGDAAGGSPQIQRLDASGGVVVTSPSEVARGNYAIYDLNRRLITMIGGVVLTRGANTVRGQRLVMDLASGRTTLDGSSGGAATGGAGSGGTGGRVSGRFTVPPRSGGPQ